MIRAKEKQINSIERELSEAKSKISSMVSERQVPQTDDKAK